jgi:hypothetical protein
MIQDAFQIIKILQFIQLGFGEQIVWMMLENSLETLVAD